MKKNKGMKITASIEARMGSSRLPGKMGMELYKGLPALGAVIERLTACKRLDGIVVATTAKNADDNLAGIAERYGARCFRGGEDDVLGRVVGAGKSVGADALVLVTGDCSCISPTLIDDGIDFYVKNHYDLVTNLVKVTYPVGVNLQVVDLSRLEESHKMAGQPPYRDDTNNFEHTNYFMITHPEIFSIFHYLAPEKYRRPDIALALDTEADLKIMRSIYSRLYPLNKFFDTADILELLKKEPEILSPLDGLKVNRVGIK
ncbi:MAG: hypothetical protein JW800_05585 [Candidatus Omnitrophica bacterium]|nr:hypothetical protein [Candidatus Omnitrophota bacterium]